MGARAMRGGGRRALTFLRCDVRPCCKRAVEQARFARGCVLCAAAYRAGASAQPCCTRCSALRQRSTSAAVAGVAVWCSPPSTRATPCATWLFSRFHCTSLRLLKCQCFCPINSDWAYVRSQSRVSDVLEAEGGVRRELARTWKGALAACA